MAQGDDEGFAVRSEGGLTLHVQGASQAELDRGLAAVYEVYTTRNVTPSCAAVCHLAIDAFCLDPSLPEPGADVRLAAAAYDEATSAALQYAGGSFELGDFITTSQWPDGRSLWNTLPTLRAWRSKAKSPLLDQPEPDEAPPGC